MGFFLGLTGIDFLVFFGIFGFEKKNPKKSQKINPI
jgi:hypothetical protein